ncbi:hypothetical protein G6F63_015877 [Rhizopus arrhizus]|nr:hypothetical protein G6F63_015877 [Rhizopus arrhizus]
MGHERGTDHFGDDRHGQASPGDQRATGGNSAGHVKLLAGRGPRPAISRSTPCVDDPERPTDRGDDRQYHRLLRWDQNGFHRQERWINALLS